MDILTSQLFGIEESKESNESKFGNDELITAFDIKYILSHQKIIGIWLIEAALIRRLLKILLQNPKFLKKLQQTPIGSHISTLSRPII